MDREERRQEPFLEHLRDSEKRLGASRHSIFEALFIGILAVVIVGGAALGIMRLRAPAPIEQPKGAEVAPVSTPVAAPSADLGAKDQTPSSTSTAAQPRKDQQRSLPGATKPTASQPAKDDRPYIDASKPGKYTIRDSKVEVEINTLSEKERNEKLEQFRKEGLLTEKEAQELKAQKR